MRPCWCSDVAPVYKWTDNAGIGKAMDAEGRRMEIVAQLAAARTVERFVLKLTNARTLDANRQDLAQMVYEVLLTFDCDRIIDMAESDVLTHYIVRIIHRWWHYPRTKYSRTIINPREVAVGVLQDFANMEDKGNDD